MKNGLKFAGQGGDRDQRSARRPRRRERPILIARRNSADFARQATIAEFGWRHARALDQADFRDRPPGQFPLLSSEACFR